MTDPYSPPMRPPSALPLVLAGAAFALTAYLVWDRWRGPGPLRVVEPRTIEARGELMEFEKTAVQIFEANKPSVAHIRTSVTVRSWFGGTEEYPSGSGSGFVWDPQGLVVTNFHVVRNHLRSRVRVSLGDGRETEAQVVVFAEAYDIAVLRLLEKLPDLRPIPLGTSADLKVGQAAFAIGNPFGFDHSFTYGIIGALNRAIQTQDGNKLEGLIQVDTAINPGNSGGPLLDSAGRLIGMTTAIFSPSGANAGLGFAVPVDTIREVVNQLLAGGVPPLIGIEGGAVPLNSRVASQRSGVFVYEVKAGGGAAEAGLRAGTVDKRTREIVEWGDVILEVNGRSVSYPDEITSLLRGKRAGQLVRLKILRNYPHRPEIIEIDVPLK